MKTIKGTETEKNLLKTFAGESQARMRYTYYASVAKKEGYEQIAAIFLEIAEQEKEHAKRMFKYLEGGMLEITAMYPAGVIGDTIANLKEAIAGESEEFTDLYPNFAIVADEEGFPEIAQMYRMIAGAESIHEERFRKLLHHVQSNTVFSREKDEKWQCRNCGYVHIGKDAPPECPACLHPQAYFQVKEEAFY